MILCEVFANSDAIDSRFSEMGYAALQFDPVAGGFELLGELHLSRNALFLPREKVEPELLR